MRDRVTKFEKFIKENEAKRRRAIQKYQSEVKLKEQKDQELELLLEQLNLLKAKWGPSKILHKRYFSFFISNAKGFMFLFSLNLIPWNRYDPMHGYCIQVFPLVNVPCVWL